MPISKPKRQQSTNTAGLRQTTTYGRAINHNEEHDDLHNASYFPLRATRFPPGTPLTAKRSRKMYSDLADEREFLLKLREQWVQKLDDLKEDHKYLSKMEEIKTEEVVNVQPLFAREEEPLELENTPFESQYTTSRQQTADAEESYSFEDDQVEICESETLDALEELEAIFRKRNSDGEDDFDEEDDEEEDEEKARIALNLMLQQFGDSI